MKWVEHGLAAASYSRVDLAAILREATFCANLKYLCAPLWQSLALLAVRAHRATQEGPHKWAGRHNAERATS